MAQASIVQKKLQTNLSDIIRFQLITHCFTKDIQLSNNELNCLTLLAKHKNEELSKFCNYAVNEKIFKTAQTVRNFFTKAQKYKLIEKEGTNKKKIRLSDDLKIQTSGNIILKYNIIHVTKEQ